MSFIMAGSTLISNVCNASSGQSAESMRKFLVWDPACLSNQVAVQTRNLVRSPDAWSIGFLDLRSFQVLENTQSILDQDLKISILIGSKSALKVWSELPSIRRDMPSLTRASASATIARMVSFIPLMENSPSWKRLTWRISHTWTMSLSTENSSAMVGPR